MCSNSVGIYSFLPGKKKICQIQLCSSNKSDGPPGVVAINGSREV